MCSLAWRLHWYARPSPGLVGNDLYEYGVHAFCLISISPFVLFTSLTALSYAVNVKRKGFKKVYQSILEAEVLNIW